MASRPSGHKTSNLLKSFDEIHMLLAEDSALFLEIFIKNWTLSTTSGKTWSKMRTKIG